jgi:hypothetical protein
MITRVFSRPIYPKKLIVFFVRVLSQEVPHSTELCGAVRHHSSKASRGEDLEVEHPV